MSLWRSNEVHKSSSKQKKLSLTKYFACTIATIPNIFNIADKNLILIFDKEQEYKKKILLGYDYDNLP